MDLVLTGVSVDSIFAGVLPELNSLRNKSVILDTEAYRHSGKRMIKIIMKSKRQHHID